MAAALPFHRCSRALDAFVLARQIPSDVPLMRRVGSSLMAPPSVSGGGTKVSERQHVNTQVDGERTERRNMHYSSSILALEVAHQLPLDARATAAPNTQQESLCDHTLA